MQVLSGLYENFLRMLPAFAQKFYNTNALVSIVLMLNKVCDLNRTLWNIQPSFCILHLPSSIFSYVS